VRWARSAMVNRWSRKRVRSSALKVGWAGVGPRRGVCAASLASIGQRDGLVVAAIMCIRLLGQCWRQDEAGELNKADTGAHGKVCHYRHRS
jgi:hypothetical protein